jgi:succinoglycan biosynthesis protein ExoO
MNKHQVNNKPNVSVVMPVHNGAQTLIESVDSVLKQSYCNFELIICNDASTDETRNILNTITDDRVRVIHNSDKLGPGLTKDRAIEMARGIWLALIDADDTWKSDRLELLLSFTESNTDKIIFDDIIECHDSPSGMIPWHVLRGKDAFGGNGVDAIEVPIDKFICSNSLLIKPLLYLGHIKQNNIRHSNLRFAEDAEFFLKLLATGLGLYYVPKPMYNYRITPGSLSATPERFIMMQQVIENSIHLFKHLPDVQSALRKKLVIEKRKEQYLPLILSLKRKKIFQALQLVIQSPWIIPDSLPRIIRALSYHMHRIKHRGHVRGIRR